jgi:hypothetical protein
LEKLKPPELRFITGPEVEEFERRMTRLRLSSGMPATYETGKERSKRLSQRSLPDDCAMSMKRWYSAGSSGAGGLVVFGMVKNLPSGARSAPAGWNRHLQSGS